MVFLYFTRDLVLTQNCWNKKFILGNGIQSNFLFMNSSENGRVGEKRQLNPGADVEKLRELWEHGKVIVSYPA